MTEEGRMDSGQYLSLERSVHLFILELQKLYINTLAMKKIFPLKILHQNLMFLVKCVSVSLLFEHIKELNSLSRLSWIKQYKIIMVHISWFRLIE